MKCFGFFFGLLMGILFLISTIGAFIAGLVWGWQLFGEDPDDPSTTTEESAS